MGKLYLYPKNQITYDENYENETVEEIARVMETSEKYFLTENKEHDKIFKEALKEKTNRCIL